MSSVPEYLGTTHIYSCADQIFRIWHVWATYEPDGEPITVHYNISNNFFTSTDLVKKQDCDSISKRQIWKFAEEQLISGLIFDKIVETKVENSNVVFSLQKYMKARKK